MLRLLSSTDRPACACEENRNSNGARLRACGGHLDLSLIPFRLALTSFLTKAIDIALSAEKLTIAFVVA